MALSILTCGGNTYGLYNSATDTFMMVGSEGEIENWKHAIELQEQMVDNRKHFDQLREQYIKQLMAGGHSTEMAVSFLHKAMPFLWP